MHINRQKETSLTRAWAFILEKSMTEQNEDKATFYKWLES